MHPNTVKAIMVWLDMYSEEELEILKMQSGKLFVTFEETLLARYKNRVPTGSALEFKAKCMKKVIATKMWLAKIAYQKSEGFQNALKGLRPDHFKKRTHTTFGYDKGQETFKSSANQHEKLSRDFTKVRSGSSEMAQEYDVDTEWDEASFAVLGTGKLKKPAGVKVNLGEAPVVTEAKEKGGLEIIESTFFEEDKKQKGQIKAILEAKKGAPEQELIPTSFMTLPGHSDELKKPGDNKNEKIVFKEANITSTLKGFNTADVTGKESYALLESDTRGSRTMDNFQMDELLHTFQRFDPVDIMERYLQKFDPLFREICL